MCASLSSSARDLEGPGGTSLFPLCFLPRFSRAFERDGTVNAATVEGVGSSFLLAPTPAERLPNQQLLPWLHHGDKRADLQGEVPEVCW